MIELFDQLVNRCSNPPADDGHQELKPAEMPRQPKGLPGTDGFQRHSRGDGHRKGIHGQGDGDEQYGDGIDWIVPLV